MKIVTSVEMREIDRLTAEKYGVPTRMLMENAGSVVKRERVFEEVWDTQWFGSMKTLDVHISGLRRKLGDDSSEPRFLHTIRGVGFRFATADEL